MNRGTYLIVLKLETELEVERPKRLILKPGYYVYVGSAMNSLTGRLKRHLTKGKKIHWHVDQLTEVADPIFVFSIIGKRLESEVSKFLSKRLEVVRGFGSSDLNVEGNLFFSDDLSTLLKVVLEVFESVLD